MFLERGNPEMQDRADILTLDDRIVIMVADGAGGISGGAEAADLFVHSIRNEVAGLSTAEDCRQLLQLLDQKIAETSNGGETTGVVVVMHPNGLFGASVGDSMAWLFMESEKQELTAGQSRRPFLGTGNASPHPFERNSNLGTLVVATDGLWKYTNLVLIEQKMRTGHPANRAAELAELVRLRSGAFPDDITVISCRLSP